MLGKREVVRSYDGLDRCRQDVIHLAKWEAGLGRAVHLVLAPLVQRHPEEPGALNPKLKQIACDHKS